MAAWMYCLLETCNDTRSVKAGLLGIERLRQELGRRIPIMLSATIEPMGSMLAGQGADAFWTSVSHADLISVGLNCGTGPEFMTDHLRTLHELATTRISCYPNAGLPNEELKYNETPESVAGHLERFVNNGWLNIVGGCCGTTPAHIKAIAEMVEGKRPRPVKASAHRVFFSGKELVEAEDSNRPLIVGERTNVIGSRLFKNLIAEEKWEEATEIARWQVKNGAHIVDVCLQSTDRDEINDIDPFYGKLINKIKAPIMIDTTDPKAIELALTYCQGKSLINSINLEDGEEKFERTCPLARNYGAALVVGCIDEDKLQAQAFTRERKLAIAQRSYQLLTEKYGIPPEDIVFDPLVFPCATGDANYIGGAVETIEGIRLIKENIPYVKTVLGISNISFGLPPAAREVVNSVFLYYCTKAGLDLAIVNAQKLERFASLPPEERRLAESLLFNTPPAEIPAPEDWRRQTPEQKAAINQFHIAAIAEHFRGATGKVKHKAADLPLDQRLANYIIEGTKDGLIPDLDRKRAEGAAPLDIINGPLMAGMSEVGRLFNNNELIVAEVLQSAEAMKASVNHLEQFMEKADTAARGKIILATVKGDVHDIGKNLVEIILANNGYTVINLGIKVLPETLIQEFQKHHPDAIGLSGLLVKSAQQMVVTAEDLKTAGIEAPILVGGAALSEKYTRNKIAPSYGHAVCYAKDAMTGLRLMNQLMDPAERETTLRAHTHTGADEILPAAIEAPPPMTQIRSAKVRVDLPIPPAPYLDRKLRDVPQLAEIWSYINPFMLYGRHLGYKGRFEQDLADHNPKALELFQNMEALKEEAAKLMKVKAVWQFFEAERDGNAIHLFAPGRSEPDPHISIRPAAPAGRVMPQRLHPRPGKRPTRPSRIFRGDRRRGHSRQVGRMEAGGRVFQSARLAGAGHRVRGRLRRMAAPPYSRGLGFPDPPTTTMQDRFTSRYRGKRYSFGYPACPNLDDQAGLWKLLRPEDIGVELTEGMMMEPEASVSAMVFHHPDCAYFTAGEEEVEIAPEKERRYSHLKKGKAKENSRPPPKKPPLRPPFYSSFGFFFQTKGQGQSTGPKITFFFPGGAHPFGHAVSPNQIRPPPSPPSPPKILSLKLIQKNFFSFPNPLLGGDLYTPRPGP